MRRIAVANQKGGCGKTTTAVNLSAALALLDRRVLLIDLDPQGHATLNVGKSLDIPYTVLDFLRGDSDGEIPLAGAVTRVNDRMGLIASCPSLALLEKELPAGRDGETKLGKKLKESISSQEYDFVVFDCPPDMGLLTRNALTAAQEVIVPVDPCPFSLFGAISLEEMIAGIAGRYGHRIEILILPTKIDSQVAFHRDFISDLEKRFTGKLSNGRIRGSIRVVEAAKAGYPVVEKYRNSLVSQDYIKFAGEVLERDLMGMPGTNGKPAKEIPVSFSLASPGARTVTVAGTFNNWQSEGIRMRGPDAQGQWTVCVDLPPGEYEYRFVVDGHWMTDPANPDAVPSPLSGMNSLIRVRQPYEGRK